MRHVVHERYVKQQRFLPIGVEGQKRIGTKHVLIIGVGALGSGLAETLVRAGIGRLTIIDRDIVERSNLQRQSLYTEQDVIACKPKAIAAAERLLAINPLVTVHPIVADCTGFQLDQLVADVDLILDGTDNFEARFFINDVAYKHNIPWVYGACSGSHGQMHVFLPEESACLACILDQMPIGTGSCDVEGIISPAVQLVVAYQATEALKILSGNVQDISRKWLLFDSWKQEYQAFKLHVSLKKATCTSCGDHPTYPFIRRSGQTKLEVMCGRDAVWVRPAVPMDVQFPQMLAYHQMADVRIQHNAHVAQIVHREFQLTVFKDGRALVHGTSNLTEARMLYQRFVG
jgi:molybdopterin/thiamine biosynthesis adenylyltransferase